MIAPAMLALCGALVAANWYARPDRFVAWSTAFLMLAVMAAAWRWARGREGAITAEINTGVIFGSAIMTASLIAKLAGVYGGPQDPDLGVRATMVVMGVYFVVMGNAIPKTLTPLATMRRDPAIVQAARRVAGWMWVTTGLAYAIVWLTLPMSIATPVSMAVLLGGAGLTALRARWACAV
jgi:hypothetical protein